MLPSGWTVLGPPQHLAGAQAVWGDRPGFEHLTADVATIVAHVLEEVARHAGHLDVARELLDGRTGLGER